MSYFFLLFFPFPRYLWVSYLFFLFCSHLWVSYFLFYGRPIFSPDIYGCPIYSSIYSLAEGYRNKWPNASGITKYGCSDIGGGVFRVEKFKIRMTIFITEICMGVLFFPISLFFPFPQIFMGVLFFSSFPFLFPRYLWVSYFFLSLPQIFMGVLFILSLFLLFFSPDIYGCPIFSLFFPYFFPPLPQHWPGYWPDRGWNRSILTS